MFRSNSNLRHTFVPTPLSELCVLADDIGIRRIDLTSRTQTPPESRRDDHALADAHEQLRAYFAGDLRTFTLPLNPLGTPFQRKVWSALQEIPYGETSTYARIATQLKKPTATRAVGAANGANPIPFIIPCHRVIGSNGALTGYALGVDLKRTLLALERAIPQRDAKLFSDMPASPTRKRGLESPESSEQPSNLPRASGS